MTFNADDWYLVKCSACRCKFYLPYSLSEAARFSENIHFWCPYGHPQHFALDPENNDDDPDPGEENDAVVSNDPKIIPMKRANS